MIRLRCWWVGVALLTLFACGSRTALDTDTDAGTSSRDAGPRRDAGGIPDAGPGRDAGRRDGGMGGPCSLAPLGDPQVVLTADRGQFDRPVVLARAGGLDFGASLRTEFDTYQVHGRRGRLAVGAPDVDFSSGPAMAGTERYPAPALFATDGTFLGTCLTRDSFVELRRLRGETYELVDPVSALMGIECVSLAGSPTGWMVNGSGGGSQAAALIPDLTGPPDAFVPLSDAAVGTEASATAIAAGFAIAFAPDSGGVLRLALIRGDGSLDQFGIDGFQRGPNVAPAVAPVGGAREPSIALAHYTESSNLLVFWHESGDLTFIPFGFTMAGDVTPALTAVPGRAGAFVAVQSYGDADPTGGLIETWQIEEDGMPRLIDGSVPTSRSRLDLGGIAAVTIDDRVVIHWTIVDQATGRPETRAQVYGCR
ncbi:MAG: hypothetical protein AB7S26_27100 [Sandaracinaceae bacterium]